MLNLLEMLAARSELRPSALSLLLDHADPVVAGRVAIYSRSDVNNWPQELKAKWERAIIRCPAGNDSTGYWLSVIFTGHPDLLAEWIGEWITRQGQNARDYEPIPRELEPLIVALPIEARRQLLDQTAAVNAFLVDSLVVDLTGDDEEMVAHVFSNPALADLQRDALTGKPNASWLQRAKIAARQGWSAEDIASAAVGSMWSGWGPESEHWSVWVADFEVVRTIDDSDARAIGEAGVRIYSDRRDRALQRERREAIFGER